MNNVDRFMAFIEERHAIYLRRQAGQPKPWTEDGILQQYRFCNVYRELDKVTQWISGSWREPYAHDPHLWFAMCTARLVNWPETLEKLTPAVFQGGVWWSPQEFKKAIKERMRKSEKVYTGAYMMRCDTMPPGQDKSDYLANVLDRLWLERERYKFLPSETLQDWHKRLATAYGFGSFLAAQVVADVKYAAPYLHVAPDWWTFAASGPGSRRGLNRVVGRPVKTPWVEGEWREGIAALQKHVNFKVKKLGMEVLHAQDVQNCLCEFDKYQRVLKGEGRPRSIYEGV